MSITLPNRSEANVLSAAALSAVTVAAQAAFIARCTVLINNATTNGLFKIEPYLVPNVTCTYVTGYFQALGYTVTPSTLDNELDPETGFPEVAPDSDELYEFNRITISWEVTP